MSNSVPRPRKGVTAQPPKRLGPRAFGRFLVAAVRPFVLEKPGQILLSAMVLLMLWGTHGRFELLRRVVPGWRGPGSDPSSRPQLLAAVPWDHELISFWGGALLLVLVPVLIIKLGFREPLANYGLGLPPRGMRRTTLWLMVSLCIICLPGFWSFARDPAFQEVYPLYRNFSGWGEFALYELTYLSFFLVIEFVFRGYLLFGLASTPLAGEQRALGGLELPGYALLLQMLPYTAWHLGKPLPELWGTLFWGFVAGAAVWAVRSIWPIVIVHWLLNVFMDGWIWAIELS